MVSAGARRAGSSARLHALTRRGMLALGALVLVSCAALVVLTTFSRQGARHVNELNSSLRAVHAVRIALSKLGRESDLAHVTQAPAYAMQRSRDEDELVATLANAHAVVGGQRPQQLLAKADGQIRRYLEVLREAEARRLPDREMLLASQPAIQEALDTLHEASYHLFDAVSRAERRLARSETIENVLGVVVAASLLVGFVVIAVTLRRLVIAPLGALGGAIDRFAAGDRSARAVPDGSPEIRHTSDSFNEMAAGLERQHEDLLTFLAGVAHDLRNPLAAMRVGLKLLDAPEPGPNKRKTLDLVDRQVTRLERMVGDFLDAARIEGGHLELQLRRSDLRALAQEAAELYAMTSHGHRLLYSAAEVPVEVRCDAERIAQVLNNLVSNAIKYSPRGGDVRVSVTAARGDAVVVVQDAGIGIAAADLTRIFEPFHRTGVSRETAPGVGLGLSVARQIIEAHGGRIDVQSTLGLGSTFRVYLPLASAEPQRAPSPAP